jgi:hypothetical protein
MLRLDFHNLESKYGFEDGDILTLWLREKGYAEEAIEQIQEKKDLHKVLYQLFVFHCKHFLNKKNKISFFQTSHNPIRYTSYPEEPDDEELPNDRDYCNINDEYIYELLFDKIFIRNIFRYFYLKIYKLLCFSFTPLKNLIDFFDQSWRM